MTEPLLIDRILDADGIDLSLQPIFRRWDDGLHLHALECLSRGPAGTPFERPDVLFDYIRRKRKEEQVDRVVVARALDAVPRLPAGIAISVNVHVATLGRDPGFVPFVADRLRETGVPPHRLIIEMVEHSVRMEPETFRRSRELLADLGVAVALDDFGLGHSNFRMLLESQPDLVKVDRALVRGCHHDSRRCGILESIVLMARRIGVHLVGEGVEEVAELGVLSQLGVEFLQGFLLARPMPAERAFAGELPGLDAPRRSAPVADPRCTVSMAAPTE